MNRNYEYVYTVYKEGSFSRAAEKLYISQPALSAAIKKIETRLHGTPLFDRSFSPLRLTDAGRFYLEKMAMIDSLETEIAEYFDELADVRGGTLRVGGASYFCTYVLPEIVKRFQTLNPEGVITLTETDAYDMEKKLTSGELDLVLDVERADPNSFDTIELAKEYILLAVPASFAINKRLEKYRISREQILNRSFLKKNVPAPDLAILKDEPFILLKERHDMYQRAKELCANAGFQPKAALSLDQMLSAYNVARNGQTGVTFFRDTLLQYTEATEKLCYYKIGDALAERSIWLSIRKNPPPSALAEEFIKYVMLCMKA